MNIKRIACKFIPTSPETPNIFNIIYIIAEKNYDKSKLNI